MKFEKVFHIVTFISEILILVGVIDRIMYQSTNTSDMAKCVIQIYQMWNSNIEHNKGSCVVTFDNYWYLP